MPRVLEALPREHPGPRIVFCFPIHEAGTGILQLEKLGWNLLLKLRFKWVIYIHMLHLRVYKRTAMADNFLPSVRDQRSLLLPAWEDWLLEGICPGSSSMRWPKGEHNE